MVPRQKHTTSSAAFHTDDQTDKKHLHGLQQKLATVAGDSPLIGHSR